MNLGDKVYIITAGKQIEPVTIIKISGGFYTVKYINRTGGTRVRRHRLYYTEKEAKLFSDKKA